MAFDAEPQVGTRYRDLESDREFEVIGLDEYEGLVTVQYDDVEEESTIQLDDWYDLSLHIDDDEDWAQSEMSSDDYE